MQAGVTVVEAKVIRTGGIPSGYGFAEFATVEEAGKILQDYQGQPIPNHPMNKAFNLNWGARSEKGSGNDYSMFVGDLGPEVTDPILLAAFSGTYQTVKLAKVMTEAGSNVSKGFGFVHFEVNTKP